MLFLGSPGTGKSHLVQALGYEAIMSGFTVLYRHQYDWPVLTRPPLAGFDLPGDSGPGNLVDEGVCKWVDGVWIGLTDVRSSMLAVVFDLGDVG